jgi:hypothetical protein
MFPVFCCANFEAFAISACASAESSCALSETDDTQYAEVGGAACLGCFCGDTKGEGKAAASAEAVGNKVSPGMLWAVSDVHRRSLSMVE